MHVNIYLEKAMAPDSSTLAWKIPWMEEPGRLQFMGSLRVGNHWATSLSLFTFMHWRRKWQPTPVFLPGESQGRGSLVGCVYGVAQSRTWLKQLSAAANIYLIQQLQVMYSQKICYLIDSKSFEGDENEERRRGREGEVKKEEDGGGEGEGG